MYAELAKACEEFGVTEFEVSDRFCTPEHAQVLSDACPGVTVILVMSDRVVSAGALQGVDRLVAGGEEIARYRNGTQLRSALCGVKDRA